jgi:hypothetical protein
VLHAVFKIVLTIASEVQWCRQVATRQLKTNQTAPACLLLLCALQSRQCMTEQHKLVAEKNALIETVKRLNREVAKLEHFKRNLLQQLQNDCEVGRRTGAVLVFVRVLAKLASVPAVVAAHATVLMSAFTGPWLGWEVALSAQVAKSGHWELLANAVQEMPWIDAGLAGLLAGWLTACTAVLSCRLTHPVQPMLQST